MMQGAHSSRPCQNVAHTYQHSRNCDARESLRGPTKAEYTHTHTQNGEADLTARPIDRMSLSLPSLSRLNYTEVTERRARATSTKNVLPREKISLCTHKPLYMICRRPRAPVTPAPVSPAHSSTHLHPTPSHLHDAALRPDRPVVREHVAAAHLYRLLEMPEARLVAVADRRRLDAEVADVVHGDEGGQHRPVQLRRHLREAGVSDLLAEGRRDVLLHCDCDTRGTRTTAAAGGHRGDGRGRRYRGWKWGKE